MNDVVVVHRVSADPNFGIWRYTGTPEEATLGSVHLPTYEPWHLSFDDSSGPMPTFGHIAEVPGALVVKMDLENNPGTSSFSYQAGYVADLAGEAAGFSLVRPDHGAVLNETECEGLDHETPTRLSFQKGLVDGGLIRVLPQLKDVYCGEYIPARGAVTDLADYNNMEFPLWLQLTESTGLHLEEVFRATL